MLGGTVGKVTFFGAFQPHREGANHDDGCKKKARIRAFRPGAEWGEAMAFP